MAFVTNRYSDRYKQNYVHWNNLRSIYNREVIVFKQNYTNFKNIFNIRNNFDGGIYKNELHFINNVQSNFRFYNSNNLQKRKCYIISGKEGHLTNSYNNSRHSKDFFAVA